MKPYLGKYKLAELDKITYKRVYINELMKNYEPSTVRLFHRLFKVPGHSFKTLEEESVHAFEQALNL